MKRKIIQYILKFLAKLVLWRYQPLIIGIAGSAGKSSTKEAIYSTLVSHFSVERSVLNLNTEIGLPLTIIRGEDAKRNVVLWLKNFLKALYLVIIKNKNYPRILILEMSEDKPGMIKYLTDLARPKIGVLSWISEVPVHVEYFKDASELAEEIEYLIKTLPRHGKAILNYDNHLILRTKEKTKAEIITYGFDERADLRITNYKIVFKKISATKNFQEISAYFHLNYKGSYVPLCLKGVFGRPQAYALTAATAVGLHFGLNLLEIVKALEKYQLLPGRTAFIPGIKNSWILDDSYNANPDSVKAALETYQDVCLAINQIKKFIIKRKVIVLGDMRELGKYSDEAHQKIGELTAEIADVFIAIGEKMKLAVAAAQKKGMKPEKIHHFSDSWQAAEKIKTFVEKGDLILVKGSRGIHTEQVTKALMLHPEEAEKLLIFEAPT